MAKYILGLVGLITIIGGGYFLFKGTGSGDQASVAQTATKQIDIQTPEQKTAPTTQTEPVVPPTVLTTSTTNTTKKVMQATLHTNKGDITIELYNDQAPQTVANFAKLAGASFYDKTKFHRVIKGFMDQVGDPLTKDDTQAARWGTGGPGYTIPDEVSPSLKNTAGTVAMANTGQPHSAGSQFFINAADNHFLDGGYTVFAKVTSGMEVVKAINNVATDKSNDRPIEPVVLESITLK